MRSVTRKSDVLHSSSKDTQLVYQSTASRLFLEPLLGTPGHEWLDGVVPVGRVTQRTK